MHGYLRTLPILPLWLIALGLAGCTPEAEPPAPDAPEPDSVRVELLAADRAFATATASRGIDGWISAMADDVVRFDTSDRAVQGRDGVRALDEAFLSNPDVLLAWIPTDAGVFRGGGLGFTRGNYAVVERTTGDTLAMGRYLTFWRRDPDGWRVIFDTDLPVHEAP